jgi:hypothetical protein
MKRLIFTLSLIITAGLITTAYSQVSIRASINLGRVGVYVKQAPVVYEPACAPAPCYDNGYNKGRVDVVIGNPGYDRRYNDRREIRYDDRNRRDRDYRDRDRRDADRDHDYRNNR